MATYIYESVHNRLAWARGRAKQHICQACGARAAHWAYDHKDPEELVDERGRRYSRKFDHYRPLCHRCHASFDGDRALQHRVALFLDQPCARCGARPGHGCTTPGGFVYTSPSLMHAQRRRIVAGRTR